MSSIANRLREAAAPGGWSKADQELLIAAAAELERLSGAPSCEHAWEPGYDNHKCERCGAFRTDGGWGIASRMVFKSKAEAEFYQKNGRYPEPPQPL